MTTTVEQRKASVVWVITAPGDTRDRDWAAWIARDRANAYQQLNSALVLLKLRPASGARLPLDIVIEDAAVMNDPEMAAMVSEIAAKGPSARIYITVTTRQETAA